MAGRPLLIQSRSILSGVMGGLGITILLQQYGQITAGTTSMIFGGILGAVVGVLLPSIGFQAGTRQAHPYPTGAPPGPHGGPPYPPPSQSAQGYPPPGHGPPHHSTPQQPPQQRSQQPPEQANQPPPSEQQGVPPASAPHDESEPEGAEDEEEDPDERSEEGS